MKQAKQEIAFTFSFRKLGLTAIALIASSIGWLCLEYAQVAADVSGSSLANLFFIFSCYYLLVALLVAVNTFAYQVISDKKLALLLALSGFLASLPLATIFNYTDSKWLVISTAFILAWLPLSVYLALEDHSSEDPAKEG
jgi:hypothetical protein